MERRSLKRRKADTYTVKEFIQAEFGGVNKRLDEVVTQTKPTNGRVTKLEGWRMILVGAALIFPVFTGSLYYLFIENLEYRIARGIDSGIESAFDERFSKVEVK